MHFSGQGQREAARACATAQRWCAHLPAHVAHVAQHWVALLSLAHLRGSAQPRQASASRHRGRDARAHDAPRCSCPARSASACTCAPTSACPAEAASRRSLLRRLCRPAEAAAGRHCRRRRGRQTPWRTRQCHARARSATQGAAGARSAVSRRSSCGALRMPAPQSGARRPAAFASERGRVSREPLPRGRQGLCVPARAHAPGGARHAAIARAVPLLWRDCGSSLVWRAERLRRRLAFAAVPAGRSRHASSAARSRRPPRAARCRAAVLCTCTAAVRSCRRQRAAESRERAAQPQPCRAASTARGCGAARDTGRQTSRRAGAPAGGDERAHHAVLHA